MAESKTVQNMFASIAEKYDLTNSVLSLGIHHAWRRALLSFLPRSQDKKVLDVCTGTGDLMPLLKTRFGSVTGVDFCLPMLKKACEKEINRQGPLIQGDALKLPFADASFDIASVAFGVRNFEDVERGLRELKRVIRPGGALLILDFGQPWLPGFRTVFNLYSKYIMPSIGGFLTGNKEAYVYLPKTSKEFPCGDKFLNILHDIGYANASFKSLSCGIAYAYVAYKNSTQS